MSDANAAALRARYPALTVLLERASKRRVQAAWDGSIIAMILEFLGPMLENCFQTEAAFIESMRDPNRFQRRRMENKVFRGLDKAKEGKRRFRKARAQQIVDDLSTEVADARSSELAGCFAEVS